MRSYEIRQAFLQYFEQMGHTRVASSSLVPHNDPTLYFTNAGMVPFKDLFLGHEKRSYVRACSSQKCMRVSGKHNDLENVGYTPRHHTFFEMLGNFSFGDYFKKEAIAYAWEFLTDPKWMGLAKDRLYVTVFQDDEEAERLWQKFVTKDRIFRRGEADNFWAMGETGPCGPCSEIHWDWQPERGKVTAKDFDGDRLFEVWNLVFIQFNRDTTGKLEQLPKPSVDTGMGLERLACLMQGKQSNWETDLFVPIVKKIQDVIPAEAGIQSVKEKGDSGFRWSDGDQEKEIALRVIADHTRAATFLIADGVLPSNEGRGYVLRRILRRAIRYGRKLFAQGPILHQISRAVVAEMAGAYPELLQHQAFVEKVLENEEVRFLETIDRGMEILEREFATLACGQTTSVPGTVVFKLYDTYGFPKDLTELIAQERGFQIDDAGFEKEMEAQRQRARAAWKGSGGKKTSPIYQQVYGQGLRTQFVGYEKEREEGKILQLIREEIPTNHVKEGDEFELIVNTTPFYAEGGGQVGDTGVALQNEVEVEIVDTQKPYSDLFIHRCRLQKGELSLHEELLLAIDSERRQKIRLNHTATHLLHAALRQTLGEHVKQAGSYLDDEYLRFDFSHFSAISDEQLSDIEAIINKVVEKNLPIKTEVLSYPEAIKKGALAFFGEKYGDVVRMVEIPGFSIELCGGTHVATTGEIGKIKIVKERSVASGVRRVEALTGEAAFGYKKADSTVTTEAKEKKTVEKIEKAGTLQQAIAQLGDPAKIAQNIKGVSLIAQVVAVPDAGTLRELADWVRQKLGSGVVVLGADTGGKVALVVMVSKDLTAKVQAGVLMKALAAKVGGTGGGRPDMAQGGGPDVEKLQGAIDFVQGIL